MKKFYTGTFIALSTVFSLISSTQACTGIQLQAQDGSVVRGRTMEFAHNLKSDLIVIPRGYKLHGTAPGGKKGLSWTTKYAVCGANFAGEPIVGDGINEKGLSAGVFFFSGYAKYPAFDASRQNRTLMSWDLVNWILTNCASIEEVRKAVGTLQVCGGIFSKWNCELPLHYAIYEPSGKSIVLEYLDGKLNIFDNPVGTITNNPEFPWHLTNLRNFVGLSPYAKPDTTIKSMKLSPLGLGSGMIGLPGDFTPPSRFVRATMLANAAVPGKDGFATVKQAFHVLRSFDIPVGVTRNQGETDADAIKMERTQWTVVSDLKNLRYYYWTENDSTIRMCDLKKCNLDNSKIVGVPMDRPDQIDNITKNLK